MILYYFIGALSILAVNLFDTTSSKDININKIFTDSELAWPNLIFEDESIDKVERFKVP